MRDLLLMPATSVFRTSCIARPLVSVGNYQPCIAVMMALNAPQRTSTSRSSTCSIVGFRHLLDLALPRMLFAQMCAELDFVGTGAFFLISQVHVGHA